MRSALFVMMSSFLVPLPAAAVDVFVNGENVTGIQNISIVNAQVRIDAQGNIHIDSPGYTVRRVAAPAAAAGPAAPRPPAPGPVPARPVAQTPSPLSRRYYLVTSQPNPGRAQFEVEVFVNGQSAGRSTNDGDALIDNITRFFRPGPNQVRVVARKDVAGGRRSASFQDTHRVIIGEGTEQNGRVVLQVPLVDFAVNASQTADQTGSFQVVAR